MREERTKRNSSSKKRPFPKRRAESKPSRLEIAGFQIAQLDERCARECVKQKLHSHIDFSSEIS
jgi:hypothetical protein